MPAFIFFNNWYKTIIHAFIFTKWFGLNVKNHPLGFTVSYCNVPYQGPLNDAQTMCIIHTLFSNLTAIKTLKLLWKTIIYKLHLRLTSTPRVQVKYNMLKKMFSVQRYQISEASASHSQRFFCVCFLFFDILSIIESTNPDNGCTYWEWLRLQVLS